MNEVKPFMKVGINCTDFHKKIICKRFNMVGKPFYSKKIIGILEFMIAMNAI